MGSKSRINSVPLVLSIFLIVTIFEFVLTIPVSIQTNGRALRSVSLNRGSSETNLLLSRPLADRDDIREARLSNSSGDGSNEAELDIGGGVGGNGTFSNDTQVGSRLRQNETEPCSLEPSSLCSTDPTHSNRDKERRIESIKNFLLTNLLGNKTRPPNKEIVRERFSGGLESIPVSCDIPINVESEAWSSDRYLSLFFNLTSKYPDVFSSESTSAEQKPADQQSHESGQSHEYVPVIGNQPFASKFTVTPNKGVSIISAKLRLYKKSITEGINLASFGKLSDSYNDTETASEEDELPNVFSTRMSFPQFTPSADEKIRVSVFWYTQPATKNHYKKKLVDTKMLSLRESSWVEFDIKNAVAAWLNDRKPNYGLVVEVENENQDVLDPRKYFHGAPCFKTAEGSYQKDEESNSSRNTGNAGEASSSPTTPMIEICTLNVPETTASYEQTKFFPFPINMNSFHHLQRVAESHARSSNSSKSRPSAWQSVNVRGLSPEDFGYLNPTENYGSKGQQKQTTVVLPTRHRHRHHHNRNSQNNNGNNSESSSESERNKARYSHSRGGFTLHEDHPLREILASVNGNSKEANKRGSQQFVESVGKGFPSNLFSDMPADEGRVSSSDYDSTEHERDVIITKIVITPAQLKENGLNRILATSSSSTAPTAASSER